MKKIITIVLTTFIACFAFCMPAFADDWSIVVNGQKLDAEVKIIDGRSLVPLRAVGEALGLKVDWYDGIQVINLQDNHSEYTAYVNLDIPENKFNALVSENFGAKYKVNVLTDDWHMYVKPANINGRVYVPVRLIASTFGAPVDVKNNVISIGQKYTDSGYSVKNISNLIYSENSVLEVPNEANQTQSGNSGSNKDYSLTPDGWPYWILDDNTYFVFWDTVATTGKTCNRSKVTEIYRKTVNTVKKELKDPVSAKFCGQIPDGNIGYCIVNLASDPTYRDTADSKAKYAVVGRVYAKNSYGAYVLNTFAVYFDESWNVTSLFI